MANIVNLQEAEYDLVAQKLTELHETVLINLNDVKKEIKTLTEMDGGFYFQKISGSIDRMLTELESEILAEMEASFLSTEEEMDNYSKDLQFVDTGMSN